MVLKDKWKNNLGLKILAVLFAIFLWWMVVNIDDPINKKTYAVDVTVTNPEVITNAGKSYQILDDTKSISVTVKARRKVLDEIKKSNIVATADLREMQENQRVSEIRIDKSEFILLYILQKPRHLMPCQSFLPSQEYSPYYRLKQQRFRFCFPRARRIILREYQ